MNKRFGGSITIFRQKFILAQCRKSSDEYLSLFHQFQVSQYFMNKRGKLCFFVKDFSSDSTENLGGKPFCASEIFRYQKKLWIKKVGWLQYHDFPSEVFCVTAPKKPYKNPSVFHLISGVKKFYE